MQQINFSKLGDEALAIKGKWSPWALLYIILLPIGLLVFIMLASIFTTFFMIAIPIGTVFLFFYTGKKNKTFIGQLQGFARDNGWAYGSSSPVPPALETLGYTADKSLVNGVMDGQNFWLYLAKAPTFQTQHRNLRDTYFLSVQLPADLPTILLLPQVGVLAPLADIVARDINLKPLELEGNFSRQIKTYYSAGQQIRTLEYLTPDVMDVIQRDVKGVVLYSGQYLSISTNDIYMPGIIQTMFKDAQIITKELKEKLHLY